MRHFYAYLNVGLFLLFSNVLTSSLYAQDDCGVSLLHGQGYTTTISSVTDNGDNTKTITLTVSKESCSGCKKMNQYAVEADAGTYSDIEVHSLDGDELSPNIAYGPNLGGIPFQGFRINNVNGMLNGQAVGFKVTYTLAGNLQDQQVRAKASNHIMTVSFDQEDFQSVLDCQSDEEEENPDCGVSEYHGQGYTTTISAVTDNGDGTKTIELTIDRESCFFCLLMTQYAVEADAGTYSDIEVESLDGESLNANISLGPYLWGIPFQGFRINNTVGMNNCQAVGFKLRYTIEGAFQDQQVRLKAWFHNYTVSFAAEDFQSVLDCQNPVVENPDILPYYPPLEGGKSFDIIGSELTSLNSTYAQTGNYISDDIFQVVGTSVLISIQTQPGQYQAALDLLTTPAYGLAGQVGNAGNEQITGLYPILNLLALNELPNLLISVSPVYSALGNAGIVTSQGDISMRSYLARDGFRVNGEGIKVGVLSDSYNTLLGDPASDDVIKGDLPGPANPDNLTPVDVLQDYPFGTRSDEGRAMLQIVHDVAPGAELAFRTGFLGATDFAAGIIELQEAGCNVIVDDITYISEPFFRDGVVAQAVDQVTALGVSYFTAAGNFGTRSWQGSFAPTAAPDDIVGEAHNFAAGEGGNDIYQSISLSQGSYTVVLQWDDGTPGNATSSDFDIYLSNENGNTLFGFNRVNTGGPALEVLPFTVAAETAQTNFLIVRESGSGPALLKYIVFRGDVTINEYATPNASTVMGQANAEGAITVGAVLFSNTPEFGVDPPTIASFSSRGGTPVNGVARLKPEITGPNGANTSVDLGGVNIDGDDFPNFFGTSAAAPHAAGVAALVLQARDKYYETGITPETVKDVLQSTAIDMDTPGYDPASGAGFIQADAALQTLANPSPFVTEISYDESLTPGLDEILLTIYGQFLNGESQVYFNGEPLEGSSTLEGDTAITATIPPFDALFPEIQVYNPPLAGTNGLDGGLSNPLYFNTKTTILVSIQDTAKTYGALLPEFSATYTLETPDTSVVLTDTELSPEELERIYAIELTTIATSLSNVGLWAIEADPADPLNPDSDVDATDSLDISLLQRFNFVFDNGLMTINPLDLVITPRDTTFVYNDSISGFTFDYTFSSDPLTAQTIGAADSLAILSGLKLSHGTALVNRPGLVRGTALVNELGELALNDAFVNRSFMIAQRVVQVRGTALVNGDLLDPGAMANALNTASSSTTFTQVRGTALVNGFSLVRGTALVNTLDTLGNITNSASLNDPAALVNSSAIMNATAIDADSNTDVIVILGDEDIAILSGDSVGNVTIRSINLITGDTVGTHLSIPGALLTNNFNVSYGIGSFTIIPDTVAFEIDAESLNQDYDGTPKSVSVSTMPEGVEVLITYDGELELPVNAGSYEVEVVPADVNTYGSANATLVINPVEATISAGIQVMDEGQAIPQFIAELTGVVEGDQAAVQASISYTVNPNFNAELPAGTYELIPSATSSNYLFAFVNGTLYVNPAGPGTCQIVPTLICYDELPASDENPYAYIAYFLYENNNDAGVFVPYGEDNLLAGTNVDNQNQPEYFNPGGSFVIVFFDEGPLTWTVRSNKSDGTSGALTTTWSAESMCQSPKSNDGNGGKPEKPTNEDEETATMQWEPINVYPNPSTGKVFLQLNGEAISEASIEVFDNVGRKIAIPAHNTSESALEIDFGGLNAGLYLIRIYREGSVQVSRVVITE
jgi:hypothetical protein